MPMGLTQAPAHFQFVVESMLKGKPEEEKLLVLIYLDDIAVFGDSIEEVCRVTYKATKRLAKAGCMINLRKSHLVHTKAKVLGHNWQSGGFWTPVTTKLEALMSKTHDGMSTMNRASLYRLLNFYRDYIPQFAELMEPIR